MRRVVVAAVVLIILAVSGSAVAWVHQGSIPALPNFSTWNVASSSIIAPGGGGAFDGAECDTPSIAVVNGTWYVYYSGWNVGTTQAQIGLASGNSLSNLVKQGVVIAPGAAATWDQTWVGGERIYVENGTYYLYYEGSAAGAGYETAPSSIGVATSSSPSGPFTKYAGNPILTPGAGGTWDTTQLFRPFMLKVGEIYYLFYNAAGLGLEQIGYATSSSPLGPFTKYSGNPVFTPSGVGWEASHVFDPQILRLSNQWFMVYSGNGGALVGIGYATSPDLITWTEVAGNPITTNGQTLIKPEIVLINGKWYMAATTKAGGGEAIWQAALP